MSVRVAAAHVRKARRREAVARVGARVRVVDVVVGSVARAVLPRAAEAA